MFHDRARRPFIGGLLSASALVTILSVAPATVMAGALPASGHFVNGQGQIGKAGQSLTVKQSSTTGVINWNSFSIGAKNSVTFANGDGATLNRVTGGNLSRIAGSLHATGSLYLLNSQGVIVSGTGKVLTGGNFVASSGSLGGTAFGSDDLRLHKAAAAVINRGSIAAGGTATLGGSSARNIGTIAAASVNLEGVKGEVLGGGTIKATGSASQAGRILLISASGKTKITGDLVARNADGSGGAIETSGHSLSIAGTVDAGRGGKWLVDPSNLTVDSTAATTIDNTLDRGTDVVLQATTTGTSGPGITTTGTGDIIIDAALSWNSTATLELDARRNINFDAPVTVTGQGNLTLNSSIAGTDEHINFGSGDNITFDNLASFLTINGIAYLLVGNVATLASDISGDPTGDYALANSYDASVDGTYASSPIVAFGGIFEGLGNTISNLTIDDPSNSFVGLFGQLDSGGLVGHIRLVDANVSGTAALSVGGLVGWNDGGTIRNATVSGTVTTGAEDSSVGGLVGDNYDGNIGLSSSSANVSGEFSGDNVGGLIGLNEHYSATQNNTASGMVTGGDSTAVGGLVGNNTDSTIETSSATGPVTGGADAVIGGLVGSAGMIASTASQIGDSWATGNVSATGADSSVGGLLGYGSYVIISGSHYDSGTVTGDDDTDNDSFTGGLVGWLDLGAIGRSWAGGTVNSSGGQIGGLVGEAEYGVIRASHAVGDVSLIGGVGGDVGGLIGFSQSEFIAKSYAAGAVSGGVAWHTGGLVGDNDIDSRIWKSYAQGDVTADYEAAGLAGWNGGRIHASNATGNVSVDGSLCCGFLAGGLVAENGGVIVGSDATGTVTQTVVGAEDVSIGGLVGENEYVIKSSWASGAVTALGFSPTVGGLVGANEGEINLSYALGAVSGGIDSVIGGLTGANAGPGEILGSYASGTVEGGTDSESGGLVGYNSHLISGSYATGDVSVGDDSEAGGLVGFNDGKVQNSHSSSTVQGGKNGDAGGLAGYSDGRVLESYATGAVTAGNLGTAGGLVAYNEGEINQSYATGSATTGDAGWAGGLAGFSSGNIQHSYSTGAASAGGASLVGGLVGANEGKISQVYSTGAVSGVAGDYLGGLVGYDDSAAGSIHNAYWDTTTSGIKSVAQGAGNIASDSGIHGKNATSLAAGLPDGFNPKDWAIDPAINGGLPYLLALVSSY